MAPAFHEGLWGISIDFIIQWASPELAHFLGYEVDDLLGMDFRQFVAPDHLPKTECRVNAQCTKTYRQRVITPEGEKEVDITPVWADYKGEKARFSHMVLVPVRVE